MKMSKNIEITKRDLGIIGFCLDMKFVDIESLHAMFFTGAGETMFGARKRIYNLEQTGYLRSMLLRRGSTKKYYLATRRGHSELVRSYPENIIPNPIKSAKVHVIDHDLGVLDCRVQLEKQGRATLWHSERRIKTQLEAGLGTIKREFMPDGIFTSRQGFVCALEFENSRPSDEKIREKIAHLVAAMKNPIPPFQAVLFVTAISNQKRRYLNFTSAFPDLFEVLTMQELHSLLERPNG